MKDDGRPKKVLKLLKKHPKVSIVIGSLGMSTITYVYGNGTGKIIGIDFTILNVILSKIWSIVSNNIAICILGFTVALIIICATHIKVVKLKEKSSENQNRWIFRTAILNKLDSLSKEGNKLNSIEIDDGKEKFIFSVTRDNYSPSSQNNTNNILEFPQRNNSEVK